MFCNELCHRCIHCSAVVCLVNIHGHSIHAAGKLHHFCAIGQRHAIFVLIVPPEALMLRITVIPCEEIPWEQREA